MASYLEKSQIATIQPYASDLSGVVNAFQTKQAYWAQGAAQVKNNYLKHLNLSLTRDDTNAELKEFMNGARSQILKMAQTDLSLADNQVRAMGIFDPITNGQTDFSKRILADHSFTEMINRERSRAESDRNREGGIHYNENAVRALDVMQYRYRNEKDPMNYQKYAGAVKYSSYYDETKEIEEAMKNFKPSTNVTFSMGKDGQYIQHRTDSSHYQSEVRAYLNAVLSDRAKESIRTKAIARFGADPETFRTAMVDTYMNDLNTYDQNIKTLSTQLKVANTDEEREDLSKKINLMQEYSKYTNSLLQGFSNKENFDKREFENMYNVYFSDYMKEKSAGFVRQNISDKVEPNAVYHWKLQDAATRYTAQLRANTDITIANTKAQTDIELERMRQEGQDRRAGINKDGTPTLFGAGNRPVNLPTDLSSTTLEKELVKSEQDVNAALKTLILSDANYSKSYADVVNNDKVSPERVAEVTKAIVNSQLQKREALTNEYNSIVQKAAAKDKQSIELLKQIQIAAAASGRTPSQEYLRTKGAEKGYNHDVFENYSAKSQIYQGYLRGQDMLVMKVDRKVFSALDKDEYTMDVRGLGKGEEKVSKEEYKNIMLGISPKLKITYSTASGMKELSPEQKQKFMDIYRKNIIRRKESVYTDVIKEVLGNNSPIRANITYNGKKIEVDNDQLGQDIFSNYRSVAKVYKNTIGDPIGNKGLPLVGKEFEAMKDVILKTDFDNKGRKSAVITSISYDKDGKIWYTTQDSENAKPSSTVANPNLSERYQSEYSRISPEIRSVINESSMSKLVDQKGDVISQGNATININGKNFIISDIGPTTEKSIYTVKYYDPTRGKFIPYTASEILTPIQLQEVISNLSKL